MCVLLLSGPDLSQVELKLLALKNVAIGATRLARTAGDGSVQTTSSKLSLEERVNFGILLPLGQGTLNMVGEFFLGSSPSVAAGWALPFFVTG